MIVGNIRNYTKNNKSWLVGNFDPAFFKTENFEFGIHKHKAGEKGQVHYHMESNEINIVLEGEMLVNRTTLKKGDMFIIPPFMISDSFFYEDTTLLVLRDKSVPTDKYEVK